MCHLAITGMADVFGIAEPLHLRLVEVSLIEPVVVVRVKLLIVSYRSIPLLGVLHSGWFIAEMSSCEIHPVLFLFLLNL